MKSKDDYARRIQQVIDYVQQHLYEDLPLSRLAAVANFSPFHCHRQFSAYTGMPLNRFIQLLRLREASYHVAFSPERPVTDIALGAGFQNAESFSRAFKREIGQTPSEFRQAPQWRPWLETTTVQNIGGTTDMQVDIVNFAETHVAACEHRGDPALLNESLQRFVHWRKANKLGLDAHATYNIIYNDPVTVTAEDYCFDVCVAVPTQIKDNDAGIVNKTIPGGRCAVLRHVGSSNNIGESVNYLYGEWLPASGQELRDCPLFFHRVKLYPAQVPEHEQITDVYLPLK